MRRKSRSPNSGQQSARLSASDHAAAASLAEQVYALAVSMLPTSAHGPTAARPARVRIAVTYAGQPLARVEAQSSGPMSVRINGLETIRRHLGRLLSLRWPGRCPPCRPQRTINRAS
jgi:hypothetical protein